MTSENGAILRNRRSIRAVSVAGGYWTGSGAVVDLLGEHSQCAVVPGEFMLFSFGQFFKEVAHPLMAGQPLGPSFNQNIHRIREFNRSEFPIVRALARRLCASAGFYPPIFFSRRTGMAAHLGAEYEATCGRLIALLLEWSEGERCAPSELEHAVHAVLDSAIGGLPANGNGDIRVGVFDQLIGPPYIPFAAAVLPKVRYINVDRDWRDQYVSMRATYQRMVKVNNRLHVRPWDEDLDDYDEVPLRYFLRLRRRIDLVKARQLAEGRDDVLWLRFEDVVLHPAKTAERVFGFLGIDPSKWEPGRCLRTEVSQTRIGKWQRGKWQRRPFRAEIESLEKELGQPCQ